MLQRRLEKVAAQRDQMRRARVRNQIPRIALVGYTNAGKSTLFNALTGAAAYTADQLFATLDPTVRRLDGLRCGPITLADTVGFVRDLPHDLVAAFRSTLSEAREADLLLHVIDAADPQRDLRIEQVNQVLADIDAGDIPQLLVYNKIDLLDEGAARVDLDEDGNARRAFVSAHNGEGLEQLRAALEQRFSEAHVNAWLQIPNSAGRLRARLYEAGGVSGEHHDDEGWRLQLDLPLRQAMQLFSQEGSLGQACIEQLELRPAVQDDWL